jgi:Ni/Fe-hydrogenase subunit HybB-like protein
MEVTKGSSTHSKVLLPISGVLGFLAFIGVISAIWVMFSGLGVNTGMNDGVPMGIWLACYIFLTGLSAGSLVVSSFSYVFGFVKLKPVARIAVYNAMVLLFIAPLFLLLDLGRWDRFIYIYFPYLSKLPNYGSALALGAILLVLYPIMCFSYGWAMSKGDSARKAEISTGFMKKIYTFLALKRSAKDVEGLEKDEKLAKLLGAITVPVAIATHGYTGFLFGFVVARPLWNTGLMPIIFLTSAVVSGTALLIILIQSVYYLLKEDIGMDIIPDLIKILIITLTADLFFIFSEILTAYYSGVPEHILVLDLLFFGPYWWLFVGIEIILGGIIPLIILSLKRFRESQFVIFASSFLIIIGVFAMRVNLIVTGQIPSILTFLEQSLPNHNYFPTLIEIFVTIGLLSLLGLLLIFGYSFLPLIPFNRAEDRVYRFWQPAKTTNTSDESSNEESKINQGVEK